MKQKHGFSMGFLWFSMIFLWFSMVFLWFSVCVSEQSHWSFHVAAPGPARPRARPRARPARPAAWPSAVGRCWKSIKVVGENCLHGLSSWKSLYNYIILYMYLGKFDHDLTTRPNPAIIVHKGNHPHSWPNYSGL